MTESQQLDLLKALSGETEESILRAFLDLAGEKIINKAYPFESDEQHEVPTKYHSLQVEIASYLLNKRGAEGETSHNENGINRSYESGSVPDSMLKGVIPFAAALGSSEE